MSRAPPFPTRRRSPSVTNGSPYALQPASAPGTSSVKPLQISRPGSRPTTPINSFTSASPTSYAPPSTAPLGPSRPQRSELRARAEYAGSERASTSSQEPYYRDSISTSRSENNGTSYRTAPNTAINGTTAAAAASRQRPQRIQSPVQDNEDATSPTSLNSALSAFKSAGSRRRQTEDSEEYSYQRERELEIEAEKARQQRIRDRAPGIRRGNTRAGEIDGTSPAMYLVNNSRFPLQAVLDQVKDGWEFVIDPNVRTLYRITDVHHSPLKVVQQCRPCITITGQIISG